MPLNDQREKLLSTIQGYLAKVPLIILGSGASNQYNYPSMKELAHHLIDRMNSNYSSDQKWIKIRDSLNKGNDLESVLQANDLSEELLNEIIFHTWELVLKRDIAFFNDYIIVKRHLPITELIRKLTTAHPRKVEIITTNYDRVVEYAADMCDTQVIDGFSGHFCSSFNPNVEFKEQIVPVVKLWKVHGSIDWFNHDTMGCKKMVHQIENSHLLKPLIVTPGREKYQKTYDEPFRSCLSNTDKAITNANSFLCCGYGFNDNHFHTKILSRIESGVPIVILSRTLRENGRRVISHAKKYAVIHSKGSDGGTVMETDMGIVEFDDDIWELGKFIQTIW